MIIKHTPLRFTLALAFLCGAALWWVHPAGAEANKPVAPIIEAGFSAWTKSGVSLALDAWQKGGLLENDNKIAAQLGYFRGLDRTVGNYRSYDVLETKALGQNSQILYLSINFEHGAVYARFHLYRSEKNWVVQNLDFSTRPEMLMPWLAFEGVNNAQ
jgi:hypothetical protein